MPDSERRRKKLQQIGPIAGVVAGQIAHQRVTTAPAALAPGRIVALVRSYWAWRACPSLVSYGVLVRFELQ